MSYDLRLCLPEEGRSPEEIATRDADMAPAADADERQRTEHLATILAAAFPAFTRTDMHDAPAAGGEQRFRVIELSAPQGGTGLQITLCPREAGLGVPYNEEPGNRRTALSEMWRCAEILEHEGAFFTYDPQLGKVLDLSKDFEAALAAYNDGARRTGTIATLPPSKRPLPLFPPELDRLPYLLRWLGVSAAALAVMYTIIQMTMATPAEVLSLLPVVGWMLVKMLVLDTARLRAIGWSPTLTFISLFPPAALFLQLLLFFLSSRLRQPRHSAGQQ